MKRVIWILSAVILLVIIGTLIYQTQKVNIEPLTNSWEIAVPNQEIPDGLVSLSAKDCGICHKEHYEEWKVSTHANAWTDLQFQAELKKESSPFMCINCHIPLQNQQEQIIKGLVDGDIYQPVKEKNPHFDVNLQQEGITCASCHVRDKAIIGPTGTKKAPHKTVKDKVFLSEKLCISCHNATVVITPTLACSFETGDEWKAGPYFGEKNCISCHMEEVNRAVVPGYPERLSHRHFFAGSGIPKLDTINTKGLEGLAYFPTKLKKSYAINETISYKLTLKNEFAGHKLPTGDPERFYEIIFEIKDQNGKIIKTKTNKIGEKWQWYPTVKKLSDNNLLPQEDRIFSINHAIAKRGKYTLTAKVDKHRLNKENAEYNKLPKRYPLFINVFEEIYAFEVE